MTMDEAIEMKETLDFLILFLKDKKELFNPWIGYRSGLISDLNKFYLDKGIVSLKKQLPTKQLPLFLEGIYNSINFPNKQELSNERYARVMIKDKHLQLAFDLYPDSTVNWIQVRSNLSG
jgi:hypothetical protein